LTDNLIKARRWATSRQAETYSGSSKSTLLRRVDEGVLGDYHSGARRRYDLDEIDAMMQSPPKRPGRPRACDGVFAKR
jgi:hypothetical protein